MDLSKDCGASIFQVKQSKWLGLSDHENESIKIFQNINNHLPVNTV